MPRIASTTSRGLTSLRPRRLLPLVASWRYQDSLSSSAFGSTQINTVAWNGSRFAVGGPDGKLATSTDGVTWTNQTGLASTSWGSAEPVNDIINVEGVFWAGGRSKVASSTDGASWTYQSDIFNGGWSESPPFGAYVVLARSPTRFVAGGGTFRLASSTDGVDWSGITFTNTAPESRNILWVIWTGTRFVAGGFGFSNGTLLLTSENGTSWTYRNTFEVNPSWTDDVLTSCAWNGSIMVALGGPAFGGFGNRNLATSTDGINWTVRDPLPVGFDLKKIIWSNGLFWAVGNSTVASSPDGITWTARTTRLNNVLAAAGTLNSIAANNNTVCIVGNNGSVATLTL